MASPPVFPSIVSRRGNLFFLGAVLVPLAAAILPFVMGPNKHLSTLQRNNDALFFLAISLTAAVGWAVYLYYFDNQGSGEDDNTKSNQTRQESSTSDEPETSRPKDIWEVGKTSQSSLKKPKEAYKGKAFGSSYYYAHNDSKTTGGYKDGLKMEDYRMNGPRLLSVNGLSVDDDKDTNKSHGQVSKDANPTEATKITAHDPNVRNITKYMWDDPGNGKGIATIRVDVLPGEKFGEFLDWKDAGVKNVIASLPGEGLLAKIMVGDEDTPKFQLKIDKLYGDAADVKVILKPKRLLIKIYKKKHGFLSKNDNNMDTWPQPHRKI